MAETEPVKTEETLSDPRWICATKEELESIEKNKTWELVDLLEGKKRRYALKNLSKFEMEHCNIVITPDEPRIHLSKNEDEQYVNPTQYRKMIGSLCYMCNVRPNLAFSVSIVSRFTERPKVSHLVAFKRILRYLKGSIGCRVLFPIMVTGKT